MRAPLNSTFRQAMRTWQTRFSRGVTTDALPKEEMFKRYGYHYGYGHPRYHGGLFAFSLATFGGGYYIGSNRENTEEWHMKESIQDIRSENRDLKLRVDDFQRRLIALEMKQG